MESFGGILGPVLLLIGLEVAMAASVATWLNLGAVATAVLALLFFREHMGRWTWIASPIEASLYVRRRCL